MVDNSLMIELIRVMGMSGAFFIAWWFTQKARDKDNENWQTQQKQFIEQMGKQFEKMMEMQQTQANNNFKLLTQILDINRQQAGALSVIESKVDQCPLKARY